MVTAYSARPVQAISSTSHPSSFFGTLFSAARPVHAISSLAHPSSVRPFEIGVAMAAEAARMEKRMASFMLIWESNDGCGYCEVVIERLDD